jgi:hypothetical protein
MSENSSSEHKEGGVHALSTAAPAAPGDPSSQLATTDALPAADGAAIAQALNAQVPPVNSPTNARPASANPKALSHLQPVAEELDHDAHHKTAHVAAEAVACSAFEGDDDEEEDDDITAPLRQEKNENEWRENESRHEVFDEGEGDDEGDDSGEGESKLSACMCIEARNMGCVEQAFYYMWLKDHDDVSVAYQTQPHNTFFIF